MSNNKFELHEERLATTDEHGHRVYLYPEDVSGIWRNRRTIFYWFLIFIFLVLPWIHYDGMQVILLNLPKREFIFLGETFYAHDAPLLLMIFLGFIFTMGFITSIWGRFWCGWSCPQTVFIDAIYRRIERIVEGKARQREKLDASPWSFTKLFKKAVKWSLFLVASLHISHSFLGYFVGTRELFWITLSPPAEHMTLFLIMLFLTALFLFDFGWFREQFCLIACPYGRIQSVMMDENSLVVAYDTKRGEPHKGAERAGEAHGDCINCYACVRSCPTGIDIRRGTQLECIACTNCIDACDDIMTRVGKDTGLIRYDRENNLEGNPVKKFGIRPKIYLLLMIAVAISFIVTVTKSKGLKAQFLRNAKDVFTEKILENGIREITNNYRVTFDYKPTDKPKIQIETEPSYGDQLRIETPINPYPVRSGHQKIFINFKFNVGFLKNGSKTIVLNFRNIETNEIVLTKELTLVGPIK